MLEKAVACFVAFCRDSNASVWSKSGVWVSHGCQSYRVDKIRQHERSQAHRDACAAKAGRTSNSLAHAFQQQQLSNRAAILCCMRCLYFLVKREISHTTNYVELLRFIEHLGIQELQCLRAARNATYTSQRIVADFLNVISSVVEDNIISKMKKSNSIALMTDESTTISVTKKLVIYGRSVVEGKLSSHFLKMLKLPDGKANTIVQALTKYIEEVLEIPFSHVSSLGSDGAAVRSALQSNRQCPVYGDY